MRQKKAKRIARERWANAPKPATRAMFPAAFVYFRRWKTLRWFLLLMAPPILGGLVVESRHGWRAGTGVILFGCVSGGLLFVGLASGVMTSNLGSNRRSEEPIAYWFQLAFLAVFYAGICVAGWIGW